MGNKTSTTEPSLSSYSQRDDLYSSSTPGTGRNITGSINQSPPYPKRSYTLSERQRISDVYVPETPIHRSGSDAAAYRSPRHTAPLLPPSQSDGSSSSSIGGTSSTAVPTSDDLKKHIEETSPKDSEEGVLLGTEISVTFDKDVKTIIADNLFEITCDSIDDPSLNLIKGQAHYDPRTMRAEFTPINTFLPNAQYTVVLKGRAITTAQCTQGANIKDSEFRFKTCDPSPKSIGVKLKGDANSADLQIASYYDLYNSLVLWCTKKWGCSGEHIMSMYIEKEGKEIVRDLDVLNVNENEIIVVEIKD